MEQLVKKYTELGLTLGSIESMTGGLFASTITGVSGASKVFKGSVVTYTCEIKNKIVGVKNETIEKFGVVSTEVAREMAEYGRKVLNVDVCVSITGNAGPTCEPGGEPVGSFYVGISTKNGTSVKHFQMSGKRNEIRNGAVLAMRDLAYSKNI